MKRKNCIDLSYVLHDSDSLFSPKKTQNRAYGKHRAMTSINQSHEISRKPKKNFQGLTAFKPLTARNKNLAIELADSPPSIASNRYQIHEKIGEGAFSNVFAGFDIHTGSTVAVKIIKGKPQFQERAAREIQVLNMLAKHYKSGNMSAELLDHFVHENQIFLVFKHYFCNLHKFIRRRGLPRERIFSISRQILHGLSQLHAANVIHCDLKPENIMLVAEGSCKIKLIDFGLSCPKKEKSFRYVQSRYYRAPEVLLGYPCTSAIDIWSFGCLLVEMYTGRPLFVSANEQEHLQAIVDVIGNPPPSLIQNAPKKLQFRQQYFNDLHNFARDQFVLDLALKCLVWEPSERITAFKALNGLSNAKDKN